MLTPECDREVWSKSPEMTSLKQMGLPGPSLSAHDCVPPVLAFSSFTTSVGDDGHGVGAPSAFFPTNAGPSSLPEKYCHTGARDSGMTIPGTV